MDLFKPRRPVTLLLSMLISMAGCGGSESPSPPNGNAASQNKGASTKDASTNGDPVLFEDITDAVDLNFVHDPGVKGDYFMPEMVGSGAAMFDFDNDGRLDLYFLQNTGKASGKTNQLFRQTESGKFVDVTKDSGLGIAGRCLGVATADIDNDGDLDVYVTQYGPDKLFLNTGNGVFKDISKQAGIDGPQWGTSTCFMDYDRDGWLDLVVVNYVSYDASRWCSDASSRRDYCGPDAFIGTATRLYRNMGGEAEQNGVRFEDVTATSGLNTKPLPGLGVFCADFDGDLWPDIFIANDGKANTLWINQRDGTFTEQAAMRGLAFNTMGKAEADMGIAIGDVDGNGLFDIFVTHLAEETHTLWTQISRGVFQDKTSTSGLARPLWRGTGFGTAMLDMDHDGMLDLAIANGRVTRTTKKEPNIDPSTSPFWRDYTERNQLFLNNGKGHFRDVSESNHPFSGTSRVARGLACGDIDNDGDMDLLVTFVDGKARLYRNIAAKRGNHLTIRAVDPKLKRDAIGAEVRVIAGNQRWMRWANPGYSYLCSNDSRVHFGLGKVSAIDRVEIIWPDGATESFTDIQVNQAITLNRGTGQISASSKETP